MVGAAIQEGTTDSSVVASRLVGMTKVVKEHRCATGVFLSGVGRRGGLNASRDRV